MIAKSLPFIIFIGIMIKNKDVFLDKTHTLS